MAIQLSPGVVTTEVSTTATVPSVATSAGAFAGEFSWGPASVATLVTSESDLVKGFGKPNANTYVSFFTASNFLSYSNNLKLVRVVHSNTYNAVSNTNILNNTLQITNEYEYEMAYPNGMINETAPNEGAFVARYPGDIGNSLKISVCSNANSFYKTSTVKTIITSDTVTINGVSSVTDYLSAGDIIEIGGTAYTISQVTGNTAVVSGYAATATANSVSVSTYWEHKSKFTTAPGTSTLAAQVGNTNASDELHIVIIDEGGKFSGVANTVLEKYSHVSKASNAKLDDGTNNYYVSKILNDSLYIYALGHLGTDWGNAADANTTFSGTTNYSKSFVGGTFISATNSNKELGYDLFKNQEDIDVSLIITGDADSTLSQYAIDISRQFRNDSITFVSPPLNLVTGSVNVQDIIDWRNNLTTDSYSVMDSGWKYQFDKYNNVYRYIPLNADIAGLCARTDNVRDPWWSPAGFNRGKILNGLKLSWNPNQTHRDELYKNSINPVVSFPGEGIVLYGDKTLQGKTSAFDRINVRRLFITLEKSISNAAKYSMFEFNDEFTRAQFVNLVEPFLRDVKGRRGIYDYRVICDATNNTPQVIDSSQFVGDIYIKPARSINFIRLNFIAVGTGVQFNEIAG